MYYTEPVFRPPSEAYSFIIQISNGCSRNTCRFCGMYKTKKYNIRDLDEVISELQSIPVSYKNNIKRIFLADGDSISPGYDYLKKLLVFLNNEFSSLQRISVYATANSVLEYSLKELSDLKTLKLKLFYMGLESGDQKVLDFVKKGNTVDEFIDASKLIKKAGMKISVTAILGLAGKEYSKDHSINTAAVVNSIEPEYFSLLTLINGGNTEYINSIDLMTRLEIFRELYEIIKNIKVNTIFRSNHSSNIVNINGTLLKDKDRMLQDLENVIEISATDEYFNKIPQFDGEASY